MKQCVTTSWGTTLSNHPKSKHRIKDISFPILAVVGAPDPVKQHQACVRQLRLYFLRWFKSFVPNLISAAAVHFPAVAPRDAFAQISLLLRRAFFLEVTAPFDIPTTTAASAFSPFYAAEELWPVEQNQR